MLMGVSFFQGNRNACIGYGYIFEEAMFEFLNVEIKLKYLGRGINDAQYL